MHFLLIAILDSQIRKEKIQMFHMTPSTINQALILSICSHRPEKVLEFDLGPGKLLEIDVILKNVIFVLEFCQIILEIKISP